MQGGPNAREPSTVLLPPAVGSAARRPSLAALSFLVLPVPASAQIFIASVADPSFAVGPLTVRATVTPALGPVERADRKAGIGQDRKSTRLNSSHLGISYAVFCLKKKT